MATKTCTIKRAALNSNTGATSWPTGQLADIPCTPLMARGEGMLNAGRSQAEYMADMIQHEIMLFGKYDIKKGDLLVLDTVEYPIWDKHLWDVADPFMVLILSDVQAVKPTESEFVR
jgi:hypothetical protein